MAEYTINKTDNGKYVEWLNHFSDERMHAPFTVEKDSDYYGELRACLSAFVKLLQSEGADDESIRIARKYSDKICEALRHYYKGKISSCHQKIENLIKGIDDHKLAITSLENSRAFPGRTPEIQFYRARTSNDGITFELKDMLHIPFSLRGRSGNYRFSIPGVTSLYLSNTSYGCWLELGKPADHDFYVSPVVLDGDLRVFNLAVMTRDLSKLNDGRPDYVHCWIKLLTLMIATSYIVKETNRTFRSEYIISQSIMLACKKLGYDGVAYYSKRVVGEKFAVAAINLAMFADYDKRQEYGNICEHLKIDEPMNYQLFKQLSLDQSEEEYPLRVDSMNWPVNINTQNRQYSYTKTDFHRFDMHLFARWDDKETIKWGNALDG